MSSYRVSEKADADLFAIYTAGAAQFGVSQADRYGAGLLEALQFIADFPAAAPERTDLLQPIRTRRYGAHVIVYLIDDLGVLILRVRHGREDWWDTPA